MLLSDNSPDESADNGTDRSRAHQGGAGTTSEMAHLAFGAVGGQVSCRSRMRRK
jgi:hypothetical protein